jgi:hypothetical protein
MILGRGRLEWGAWRVRLSEVGSGVEAESIELKKSGEEDG